MPFDQTPGPVVGRLSLEASPNRSGFAGVVHAEGAAGDADSVESAASGG